MLSFPKVTLIKISAVFLIVHSSSPTTLDSITALSLNSTISVISSLPISQSLVSVLLFDLFYLAIVVFHSTSIHILVLLLLSYSLVIPMLPPYSPTPHI